MWKVWKARKRSWHELFFIISDETYDSAIHQNLFALTNQDSTISHTREKSKMFDITSKYFTFFKNTPPATWVAHTTRNFITCYSCSYYSFMMEGNRKFMAQKTEKSSLWVKEKSKEKENKSCQNKEIDWCTVWK